MSNVTSRVIGQRYQAQVPDTLDLAARGALALHALAGGLDHDNEYRVLGGGECGGVKLGAKFAEAFSAMRVMSGSDHALGVEEGLMQALLANLGQDGLLYTPGDTVKDRVSDRGYESAWEDYTDPCANGRMILAMMYRYQQDQDPVWPKRIRKMVAGLARMAQYGDDYAYFPEGGATSEFAYLKHSGYRDVSEPQREHVGPEGSVFDNTNHPIRALSQWYQMSGDTQALDLARKITKWLLKPVYWVEGDDIDIVGPERGRWDGHFHGHMITFRSLLWYAEVSNDRRVKELVRSAYEYALNFGLPRIGWFPSWIGPRDIPTLAETISYKKLCEGCILGDVVALAIKLSDAGMGDYWEDVDGYVRNQLVEQQFTDPEAIRRVKERVPVFAPKSNYARRDYLGGYCGGSGVTCIPETSFYPSACCVPNGALGLYYAWESIVRHDNGSVRVNLLLNRASPWVDVDSYLPYEGKVVVRNKSARRVALRVPGWAPKQEVEVAINDKRASPFWVGNYMVLDGLSAQDVITVEFPVVEQTVEYTVPDGEYVPPERGGQGELSRTRYTCCFKGNTLVNISPRDETSDYPIYRREEYKENKAPVRDVTRYVSPYTISW